MSQILPGVTAVSGDVLKVEHRSSEPFDHAINPATIDTIDFSVGEVAAVDANGYIVRADIDDLATISLVGLFMSNRNPADGLKNNYVDASGNATVFSNGTVILNTQIVPATITAGGDLFISDNGTITNVAPVPVYVDPAAPTSAEVEAARALAINSRVGKALTSRTVAGADVRVKLEL